MKDENYGKFESIQKDFSSKLSDVLRRISVIEAQDEYKLRIIDEQKESVLNVYGEVELFKIKIEESAMKVQ